MLKDGNVKNCRYCYGNRRNRQRSGVQTATVTITDDEDCANGKLERNYKCAENAVAIITAALSHLSTTATVITLSYTGAAVNRRN
jgi:hypothetical protein